MKKIIIASLLVVMAATSSFAATSQAVLFTSAGGMGIGVVTTDATPATIGRLSSKDSLGFSITTAGYTLITQHQQGTRSYGTAHDGTAIYWTPETKGSGHAAPGTVGVANFATGWTVM